MSGTSGWPRIVIGLGANLGDRLASMRQAEARIAEVATVRARSRVYETAPVGLVEQPPFLNAAIAVESALSPLALLDALLAIERSLGRDRSEDAVRWGPRTMDLDLLLYGDLIVEEPDLVVPHPELIRRSFVLVPLVELDPLLVHPGTGETLLSHLSRLNTRPPVKRGSRLWN